MSLKDLNRYDEAKISYQKAIELARKLDEKERIASYVCNLSGLYFDLNKFEEGIILASQAFEIAVQIGDLNRMQFSKVNKGKLLLGLGKASEALQEMEEAKVIADQIGINAWWILPELLANLALGYLVLGDLEKSYQYATNSLSEAEKHKLPGDISCALDTLGQVETARKTWESAEQHFKQAISTYEQMGNRHRAARTRCHFADALLRQGQPAAAEPLLRQAVAVFQELKLEHEIKKAEELLQQVNKGGDKR